MRASGSGRRSSGTRWYGAVPVARSPSCTPAAGRVLACLHAGRRPRCTLARQYPVTCASPACVLNPRQPPLARRPRRVARLLAGRRSDRADASCAARCGACVPAAGLRRARSRPVAGTRARAWSRRAGQQAGARRRHEQAMKEASGAGRCVRHERASKQCGACGAAEARLSGRGRRSGVRGRRDAASTRGWPARGRGTGRGE